MGVGFGAMREGDLIAPMQGGSTVCVLYDKEAGEQFPAEATAGSPAPGKIAITSLRSILVEVSCTAFLR